MPAKQAENSLDPSIQAARSHRVPRSTNSRYELLMTYLRPIDPISEAASDCPDPDQPIRRRRLRRGAWRDGLAAQTVIENLEDIKSYRAFERTIIASFGPRSAVEVELIHRLASLLWRLRRALTIETGLFQNYSALHRENGRKVPNGAPRLGIGQASSPANGHGQTAPAPGRQHDRQRRADGTQSPVRRPSPGQRSNSANTPQCFLRLAELDPISLERVGAYEARLWRQVAQTIWLLDALRRPRAAAPRRPSPKPIAPYLWHCNG